jgi:MFS family permease
MVSTILPLYLMFGLGLSPLAFGVVDGLYQGGAALVRVASGVAADRWRRQKELAVAGYGLSAICKVAFLVVGAGWTAIGAVVLLDRTGKGIRTAPRDALISLSSPAEDLGTAFGVHRALDTAGAMIGPLLAFGLLALVPGGYDAIFVVSFFLALIGLGVIGLFVEGRTRQSADVPVQATVSLRAAAGLLRAPYFRALVLVGAALGLVTMSDAFVYLGLQNRLSFSTAYFPLLYIATALIYMVLAVPMGRLADRGGRLRVFIGGYALMIVIYGMLLLPSLGLPQLALVLLLFGTYYAATDGVLMALASAVLPAELRTSGLSLLSTATNVGRLLASVLFGALWAWRGLAPSVSIFLGGLTTAVVLAAIVLIRMERNATHEQTAATSS